MRFAVYVALLLALVGPPLLVHAADRMRPRTAALTLAAGGVVCAVVWSLGLAVLAVVTVARVELLARLGGWSAQSLRGGSPVPVVAGVLAAAALTVSLTGLGVALYRVWRSLVRLRALRGATGPVNEAGYVLVPSQVPEAMTVPGWPGTILVTSAMVDALSPSERRVLLAHERCHLLARHWVFQLAARLSAATLPLGRPIAARCDQALERWADEQAARVVGDRRLVARTVAKAALLATPPRRPVPGVGMADGVVVARVQALLQPLPEARPLWITGALCTMGLTLLAGGEAVRDAGALLRLAHHAFG